jgi:hypothetical protein
MIQIAFIKRICTVTTLSRDSSASKFVCVDSSWNVTAHGDPREGKWSGKWRMEWVSSTLHTTSEHGVSNIPTADAHTSAASSRLNWRPHRCKWTSPFRRKTKSGFCACAITFQLACTTNINVRFRLNIFRNKPGLPGISSWISQWKNLLMEQSDCSVIWGIVSAHLWRCWRKTRNTFVHILKQTTSK